MVQTDMNGFNDSIDNIRRKKVKPGRRLCSFKR